MKNKSVYWVIWSACLFLVVSAAEAQGPNHVPKPRPTGTGRTTAHIVYYIIDNPDNKPYPVVVEPSLIPSDKGYQAYIVPEKTSFVVPPKGSVTQPLSGYCLNIHTLPIPAGQPTPPVDAWITIQNAAPVPQPGATLPAAFVPTAVEAMPVALTYPGTTIPFPYTINLTENLQAASGLVFDVVSRITQTYDVLAQSGQLSTPLPPERQRTEIIQQTIWYVLSVLEGNPYTRDQLRERVVDQYETNSGKPLATAPPEVKKELENGVVQIWSTISLVGTEAKVLDLDEKPAKSSCCVCDSIPFKVTLRLMRDTFNKPYTLPATITFKGTRGGDTLSVNQHFKVNLKTNDVVSVAITPVNKLALACSCPDYAIKCTGVYPDKETMEDKKPKSDTLEFPSTVNGISVTTEGMRPLKEKDLEMPGQVQWERLFILWDNWEALDSFEKKWETRLNKAQEKDKPALLKQKEKEEKALQKDIDKAAKKRTREDNKKAMDKMKNRYGNAKIGAYGQQYLFIITNAENYDIKFSGAPWCADLGERCTPTACYFRLVIKQ